MEEKLKALRLVQGAGGEGGVNLQIATYGIGGFLSPHYDTYRQPGEEQQEEEQEEKEQQEEWSGTVMGYLSTVEEGGHTVFPR